MQIGPADLDRYATSLKNLFASQMIRIPPHPLLLEQLESLIGAEQRRRDLVKFTHRTSAAHDDLPVAIALAADALRGQVGKPRLPQSFCCLKQLNQPDYFYRDSCFLVRGGCYFPSDPICYGRGTEDEPGCAGFNAAREMHREHLSSGGEPMHLRDFVARILHAADPNVFDERRCAHIEI